jgi:hypothetical protein
MEPFAARFAAWGAFAAVTHSIPAATTRRNSLNFASF